MTPTSTDTGVYTDLQGLTRLKVAARDNTLEAERAVAKQFEALFIQMMLKSMRDASMGDELFGSDQVNTYRDMFDQQLSLSLANGGGIGLASTMLQQLGGRGAPQSSDTDTLKTDNLLAARRFSGTAAPLAQPAALAARTSFVGPKQQDIGPLFPVSREAATNPVANLDTPENFIQALWPHAEKAAQNLGVQPEVLLAQAALETGWGQSVIGREGASSYNLFNIKADSSWDGRRVSVPTLEYVDGIAVKRTDAFRAYDSYAASFDDYVAFLRENPRYGSALRQAADPQAFVQSLQKAGYATDPRYAQKITSILHSDTMSGAVDKVMIPAQPPITLLNGRP